MVLRASSGFQNHGYRNNPPKLKTLRGMPRYILCMKWANLTKYFTNHALFYTLFFFKAKVFFISCLLKMRVFREKFCLYSDSYND